jgi:hypothetical protein
MDPIAVACALAFELWTLWGFAAGKFGAREHNQNILINGFASRTSIPIADGYIAKLTINATNLQRTIARRLAQAIRAFVNTRAFELILLQKVGEQWPGQGKIDEKVRLIV